MTSNEKLRVTVIGGSGFVGTNFCQQLNDRKVDFEIIDIKPSNRFPTHYKWGDVRNIDTLRSTVSGDIVVNLAAVHRDDVQDAGSYYSTNVDGARNIATVCTEKQIHKLIFTSTVAVYGFAEPDTDETGAIKPFNEYGKTNFLAEQEFIQWQKATKSSLIILRPTVIFGEGNRGNVYNLFNSIARNRFIMISEGKNHKSIAYVANFTAFLTQCIQSQASFALYNYVDTPTLSMRELVSLVRKELKNKPGVGIKLPRALAMLIAYGADAISKLMNKSLPISSVRVRKFTATTSFRSNTDEVKNFKPPYSLESAIQKTLKIEFQCDASDLEVFYTE